MGDKIRIVSLGGLDEEGKNCLVIDINGDLFVVGAGVMEPDKTMPGVDYVIPQFDYLKENKDRIKGYFLLHGHDDEVGGLAYIYNEVPAPIYASKVTFTMLEIFTRHVKRDPAIYDFHPVAPSSVFKVAGRTIHFFHTAHNIADSSGMAIETSEGNIVITGDYVVENAADRAYLNDMNALAIIADKPTLALLPESVYAGRAGYTAPLYKVTPHVSEVFKKAKGRIFVSIFSTDIYNVEEVIRLAMSYKKKVVFYDKATSAVLEPMMQAGAISLTKDAYCPSDDILRYKDSDLVFIMVGFGTKLFRKITSLAMGQNEDRRIRLKESDWFVMASLSSDNSELEYTDAADALYRCGCEVTILPKKRFLRMHASEEDLKMMASILKPKYYIPVKGFYKDLLANAMLALSMGLNLSHSNVFVVENGMSILIDEKGGRIMDEKIPHGDLMIDGSGVGDISANVLADREKLSEGVMVLALTISSSQRKIIAGPEVAMRGFLIQKEGEAAQKEASKILVSTVNEFLTRFEINIDEMKQNVYEKVLRGLRRLSGKVPMVLPLIVDVG